MSAATDRTAWIEVDRHPTFETVCPECNGETAGSETIWCESCEGTGTILTLEGENMVTFLDNCGFQRGEGPHLICGVRMTYFAEREQVK